VRTVDDRLHQAVEIADRDAASAAEQADGCL
jgi:hypothetical protein